MNSRASKELIIEAGRTEGQYWKDLWQYRELFYFLSWRDILVRYKQTAIGIAWALIRPFLTMVVFTVVFGNLAKLPSHGTPYALLVFSAMLPWQFFSSALGEASNSLVSNSNLISKIYFPRLIIPASSIMVSLVDFMVSGIILLGLMIWYNFVPTWRILTLPFFVLIVIAAAMGKKLKRCSVVTEVLPIVAEQLELPSLFVNLRVPLVGYVYENIMAPPG